MMTDALSGVVTFNYDAAGQQTSVVNPNGKTNSFTYDSLGNVLIQTDPLSRTTTNVYDLAGRTTQTTDPRGVVRGFSYDAADRLTGETYPGGGTVTYGYDAAGQRTSMVDATGTTTWVYDAAGRTTSAAAAAGTVAYTYNNADQRSTMTLPSSRTVTYAYDSDARLASLTDWQSRTTSFGYDVNSRRTSITRPNGVVSTYGYDAASRITSIVHVLGGSTLQSFSYAYDAADNRTSVSYGGATESYVLDALNRLTSVTYPGGATTGYTYDANGNRATKVAGGVMTTYTYDSAGQLSSEALSGGGGTASYTYDAAGNQTARGADTFTWDYASRMSGATVGGTAAAYTYDADGIRTKKVVSGTTTNFVWDHRGAPATACTSCGCGSAPGALPMLIDDGTNGYLFAGGLIAQVDGSNNATYGLEDALASLRGATDGSGTVVGAADYDAFGAVRTSTGTMPMFGFTGEELDSETGFEYLRARYLDPSLGRFASVDTVQPNGPGTQGWNLYTYVTNNPARLVDPAGHFGAAAGAWPPPASPAAPEPIPNDNLAPYMVAGAVLAGGALAMLGVHVKSIFEYLALVFDDKARPLMHLIEEVVDEAACLAEWEKCNEGCRGKHSASCWERCNQHLGNCLAGRENFN